MAMTIVEKILARAGGVPNVSPGDLVVVNVDTAVLFDNNFSTRYWSAEARPRGMNCWT